MMSATSPDQVSSRTASRTAMAIPVQTCAASGRPAPAPRPSWRAAGSQRIIAGMVGRDAAAAQISPDITTPISSRSASAPTFAASTATSAMTP